LLEEINKKSEFWKRDYDKNKEIDLRNINLSLIKYIE